ncbi:DNA polymerase III, subunit gamma and tau [candidate division WWE3 bacterium CG08_land_8_20_14_0_20_41_10]|uniref:DNA polymerase III subunit gamma/tau n=1 Tax=candidate division WWE3 bacterium CG08_land_8_20_14_0_20_41_10 TaxID=1975085 RepID=A0A2H0XCX8_UNCKA|nr:MAG: DNA polymerase III, subunit gamma and tau [candidate division WWE3 bacterium CG08_land_8_20_14_0_20_41_10]
MYYTKYRPQTFKEIQRPNDIADALMQQIKTDKTVHAYLFTGPRGIGKTTVARLLAKGLSCINLSKEGDVCGKCAFCLAVQNGNLIDLIEIDAASNRGIDDIRDLKEKVRLLPVEGKKKIYIIDEVHMLTNEAFNALLKTLEEPPKHAVFILCTTEFHKVPETIKSRCQVFKFKRPTRGQIVEKLKRIADLEVGGEKLALAELEKVAVMAGGAFRDAETILQQLIEAGVGDAKLNAPDSIHQFLNSLSVNNATEALQIINTNFDDGVDLAVWTDGLIRYLRDLLYLKMGFSDDYFSLDSGSLSERKTLAVGLTKDWLVKAVEVFNITLNDLKSYSIPQLALEIAVVKLIDSGDEKKPNGDSPKTGIAPKPLKILQPTPERETSEEVSPKDNSSTVIISAVQERWREIVAQVSKINSSVGALLKSSKPISVEGSTVLLEVSYKFYKERLESSANLKIVEKVLDEVLNCHSTIKCVVCPRGGDLTDMNVRIPQNIVITSKTSVVEVFDGGLPL